MDGLTALTTRDGGADPRYFEDGVWVHDQAPCFRCDVGPGVAAAALGALSGDERLKAMAIRTMDSAVQHHRLNTGAYGPPAGGETGPDIQTMFFAVHLGLTLHILGTSLDSAHRIAWTDALRAATDFLVRNGNFTWYTNGNISLGNAVVAGITAAATGQQRYADIYDEGLAFALDPPQSRWPGRGLILTRQPAAADGADGAGYLTETAGNGPPGFDADYTQTQADFAAILALVTADPRAIRLTNLLANQLLPRVDRTTWLLDTSSGSRHPDQHRTAPFTTCAAAVLAAHGRNDLVSLVDNQVAFIGTAFAESGGYTNVGMYQLWGSRMAPTLMVVR
ncbi:hypothetical protein ACFO1B_39330 [Dactylosporangium siamense]|nr:hypothetical protein [Dactylosporangium siamense]